MKLFTLLVALSVGSAAAIASSAPSFLPQNPKSAPLALSQGDDGARASDLKKWIDQLGSPNFDERDAAIEHLRARGKEALGALDDAVTKSDDPEIRWNARRLARDIRDGRTSARVAPRRAQGLREVPRSQDATPPTAPTPDVPGFGQFHGDFQQEIERLHEELRDLQRSWPQAGAIPGMGVFPGGGFPSVGDSNVVVQISDDHVKVVVRKKDENGESKAETYEADSMEQFREKYPEIAERYFSNMRFQLSGPRLLFRGPSNRTPAAPFAPVPMIEEQEELEDHDVFALGGAQPDLEHIIGAENGERLGVHVGAVHPAVAKFLGLQAERGFVVESVEPGSLAESLGLKANDVVLSIAGKTIGENATIREALASVEAGATMRVEIVRGAEGTKTLSAKKPAAAEKSDAAPKELRPVETPKRSSR